MCEECVPTEVSVGVVQMSKPITLGKESSCLPDIVSCDWRVEGTFAWLGIDKTIALIIITVATRSLLQ